MKIIVAGDFCQRYRTDSLIRNKAYNLLFKDIKPIVERADISIVNFEFPIIKEGKTPKPITKCGPNLKGSIEAVDAIKYAGFNCCTLANNHILDQGADCCMDTIECLKSKGLLTVGAGNNIDDASEILYFESEGIKLAIINCCEHEFTIATDESPGANPLNPIQQFYKIIEAKKNADIVMAIIHGGPEFYQLPTIRMQETYRYFIDCGADIVVNHHQHCFSGYEIYKDKTIFYGLGNLCFDDIIKKDGTWVEGYMLEFDISVDKSINFKLYPYKQCSDEVGVHLLQDACDFEKKIHELNNIISDACRLKEATIKYYDSQAMNMICYYSYENIILSKLYRLGLIPHLHSKKRLLSIWNVIECESHRDKMYHAFNKHFESKS